VQGSLAPSDRVSVALSALRADAAQWARAADDLRAALATASARRLDPTAFSFAGAQLAASYASLTARLTELLHQGCDTLDAVAAALRASADAYEAEEAAGVHRMTGIT